MEGRVTLCKEETQREVKVALYPKNRGARTELLVTLGVNALLRVLCSLSSNRLHFASCLVTRNSLVLIRYSILLEPLSLFLSFLSLSLFLFSCSSLLPPDKKTDPSGTTSSLPFISSQSIH